MLALRVESIYGRHPAVWVKHTHSTTTATSGCQITTAEATTAEATTASSCTRAVGGVAATAASAIVFSTVFTAWVWTIQTRRILYGFAGYQVEAPAAASFVHLWWRMLRLERGAYDKL